MTTKERTKYKKQIADYLKSKDNYNKLDELLLDELCDWININEAAKADLAQRGLMINVRKDKNDEPFLNLNQSHSVVNQSSKQIQKILELLTLAPSTRLKGKKEVQEKKNGNQLLNEFINFTN